MRLSVVIPARNEEENLVETVPAIARALRSEGIAYQIVIVDDDSSDGTAAVVERLGRSDSGVELVRNTGRHGYGLAVRAGLRAAQGDAIAVMMADGSDRPADLVGYYRALERGYDCAFGSRFMRGSSLTKYPRHKLVLNRLGNLFIRTLFGLRYNDVTNAFKCYRREVIQAMEPLISPHFNLTVEMPLKAIIRGCSYAVMPIGWSGRQIGVSSLKIKEMGSRYLFIVLYLWLEKHLSRGDYRRDSHVPAPDAAETGHVRP